jgi:DNA-binding NarL/FixJ family response regulator
MQNQISEHRFSDWEIAVMAFLVKGRSTREIGAALGVSENTTRGYLKKVFKKTGTRDRFSAAQWAAAWLPFLYQARHGQH